MKDLFDLVYNAAKMSLNNSAQVAKSKKCGCYHCCSIFDAKEVVSFIDEGYTALCPKCGINSVIPDSSDENLSYELLTEIKDNFF